MSNEYELITLKAEAAIGEYLNNCVDVEKFLSCCKKCRNYGGIWSCPEFGFDPNDIWKSYTRLLLYGKKIAFTKEACEKPRTQAELDEWYNIRLSNIKRSMLRELLEMEKRHSGSRALSAGPCSECAICARKRGLPCEKPELMRYSIEALGGDVGKTLERYLGEKLLWAQQGRLPAHFILLGGLLIN